MSRLLSRYLFPALLKDTELVRSRRRRERFYKDLAVQIFRDTYPSVRYVTVAHEGLRICVDLNDATIGKTIIETGDWQLHNFSKAMQISKDHGVEQNGAFINIGANIGLMSLYALHYANFDRSFAIEPHPENAQLIRVNAIQNRVADKVVVLETALSSTTGQTELWTSEKNSGKHRLFSNNALKERTNQESNWHQARISVEVSTLDKEMSGYQSDDAFVWMDAEFHEGEIMAGGRKILSAAKAMVTEFYPYFLYRQSKFLFVDEVERHFRSFFLLKKSDGAARPIEELRPIFEEGKNNLDIADDVLFLKKLT